MWNGLDLVRGWNASLSYRSEVGSWEVDTSKTRDCCVLYVTVYGVTTSFLRNKQARSELYPEP